MTGRGTAAERAWVGLGPGGLCSRWGASKPPVLRAVVEWCAFGHVTRRCGRNWGMIVVRWWAHGLGGWPQWQRSTRAMADARWHTHCHGLGLADFVT